MTATHTARLTGRITYREPCQVLVYMSQLGLPVADSRDARAALEQDRNAVQYEADRLVAALVQQYIHQHLGNVEETATARAAAATHDRQLRTLQALLTAAWAGRHDQLGSDEWHRRLRRICYQGASRVASARWEAWLTG